MESEKYSWQGYLRQDGRCGIRNHILVIYTVKCSEFVARKIVENSDDPDVELIGFDGCTDNQYAVNLLISMIRHPNVGAVCSQWGLDVNTSSLSGWRILPEGRKTVRVAFHPERGRNPQCSEERP